MQQALIFDSLTLLVSCPASEVGACFSCDWRGQITSSSSPRVTLDPAARGGIFLAGDSAQTANAKSERCLTPICPCLQICLDCYLDDSEKVRMQRSERKMVSQAALLSALDDLKVPTELWPLGARLAVQSQILQQKRLEHLKDLLVTAVQVSFLSFWTRLTSHMVVKYASCTVSLLTWGKCWLLPCKLKSGGICGT